MEAALNIITILVAILLIMMIMVQTKGSSFGTGFGGGDSMYTTRRGFEKTLFQATIGVGVFFVLLAIISSFALS